MKYSNYLFGALALLAGIFLFTDITKSIMGTILSVVGIGLAIYFIYSLLLKN